MQPTEVFSTAELSEKLNQLLQSGLSTKQAIMAWNETFKDSKNYPFCYYYKKQKIEICHHIPPTGIKVNLDYSQWESNIHCDNNIVVTVGYYPSQVEAALMAEKTINAWS